MAESICVGDGGSATRKKRAWRKPREPATPALDEEGKEKAPKTIKLVREHSSRPSTTLSSSTTDLEKPNVAVSGRVRERETEIESDRETVAAATAHEQLELNSLVTIDGSVMEGVINAMGT